MTHRMIEDQGRARTSNEHEERRSVLMFAYYFPPCVCWPTASMRAEGLAKGLIPEGWNPIVVTRGSGCRCFETRSSVAVTDMQSGIEVRRVDVRPSLVVRASVASERWREAGFLARVGYWLLKPVRKARRLTEDRDDWPSQGLGQGRALLCERDVHAVWTTSVPYLSIGIGRRLQRRHRTPWVADLRDSITRERVFDDLVDKIAGRHVRRRWYRALKKASAVVGVTPQEAEIDGKALGRPVHPIPSGFDLTAWESLRTISDSQRDRGKRFQILYAGGFYGERAEQGDLFFQGLRRFIDSSTSHPEISFTYIGRHGRRCLSVAAENDCEQISENGGMVTPEEARLAMMRADLVLLLSPPTREGGIPGGKLYEYLAAGPSILAVPGTDRYVMGALRDADAGEGASTPDEIAAVLASRYESWRRGRGVPRSLDGLGSFTWSARAHQLADLLDQLAPLRNGDRESMDPIAGAVG